MAKYFIVGAKPITYHPKDEHGNKLKNVDKHALNLSLIKKTLSGAEVETLFVGEDMELYSFIHDNIGKTCNDICNWSVNIERNNTGFIEDFEPIKHYDSLIPGLTEMFGKNPTSDK